MIKSKTKCMMVGLQLPTMRQDRVLKIIKDISMCFLQSFKSFNFNLSSWLSTLLYVNV